MRGAQGDPARHQAIYRAGNVDRALLRLKEFEAAGGKRYPPIGQMWRRAWSAAFRLRTSIRKMIYTTNAVEALHRSLCASSSRPARASQTMPPSSSFISFIPLSSNPLLGDQKCQPAMAAGMLRPRSAGFAIPFGVRFLSH
jgi:transposase-like protein